jgi:hypothetical protein
VEVEGLSEERVVHLLDSLAAQVQTEGGDAVVEGAFADQLEPPALVVVARAHASVSQELLEMAEFLLDGLSLQIDGVVFDRIEHQHTATELFWIGPISTEHGLLPGSGQQLFLDAGGFGERELESLEGGSEELEGAHATIKCRLY